MIKYAELSSENIVVNIIVSSEATIALLPGKFIKYGTEDTLLRGEPSISSYYDEEKDVFIQPKPYPSWTLNELNEWHAPVPRPAIGIPAMWDEENQTWIELEEVDISL